MKELIKSSLDNAKALLDDFITHPDTVETITRIATLVAATLSNGHKVISCGNGGSMCDAMHFAEELTGRFRGDRRSLPAIAISDPSHITCTANDYGFDYVFSRYIEGLGQSGDTLFALSTSGNSPNIIKAVEAARKKEMKTICLLGKDGGKLKTMADIPIVIPGKTSDRIQEVHIKIIHITIEAVERALQL